MSRFVLPLLAWCAGWLGCAASVDSEVTPDRPLSPTSTSSVVQADPPNERYFKTESSDEWVRHNFELQASYARVLLVGEPRIESISIAKPGLGPATEGAVSHRVDAHYATIQEAIDASGPGDLVAVQPGRYAGFVLGSVKGAGPRAFTFIRALGPPGAVVIDRPGAEALWMFYLRTAHHVVIDGFHLVGTADGKGPRAGIMLDGDFGVSGKLVRNVAISRVLSEGHRTWGLHATDTATVLVQESAFARSVEEHGLYTSDGSDDWVIRKNVFFDNFACGLQINLDPLASLEETVKHVGMMGMRKMESSRKWAEEVLARSTAQYGADHFPDGIGKNFIIEDNVATNNGKKGGAAYNFAALTESLIQRNLAYENFAGGLALWDNANPFDQELVDAPATKPDEWVDSRKPLFGSRDDVVRYNTFLNRPSSRAAVQCRNGSWGLKLLGNIAVHGKGPGLWITADSLPGLEASGNVMGAIEVDANGAGMRALAKVLPEKGSKVGASFDDVTSSMTAPSSKPWVVIEGGWWKVAPARPDFTPRDRSVLQPFGGASQLGAFVPR